MTHRQIDIPEDRIQGLLADYDNYLIARAAGAGKLEEYIFWKSAAQIFPEIATGNWMLCTDDPLRPFFHEVHRNEKRYH